MSRKSPPPFPGGFPPLVKELKRARTPIIFGPDDALPDLDTDLDALKQTPLGGEALGKWQRK